MQNRYSEQVIFKVLNANNNNDYYDTVAIGFWCASLYSNSRTVKCPLCNSYSNLESIPLSRNESFKFDYHPRTGTVLEFSPKK